MFQTILIAVTSAIMQALTGVLFWRVSVSKHLTPKKKKIYSVAFVACLVIGIASVGLGAYRSNANRAFLAVRQPFSNYMQNGQPALFPVGEPLAFNLAVFEVGGRTPAKNITYYTRAYLRQTHDAVGQQSAKDDFSRWMAANKPILGLTAQPNTGFYFSAQGDPVSSDDVANIMSGKLFVFLIADIKFTDDFGGQEYKYCQWLHTPQQDMQVWEYCSDSK
jgi:hypothetical protein